MRSTYKTVRARALWASLAAMIACAVAAPAAIAAAPANDNFAAASPLGATFNVVGTTVDATGEPGEPDHADVSYGSFENDPDFVCPDNEGEGPFEPLCQTSVWFNWTAETSGTRTFQTCVNDFDTILAVYTGSSVSALTEIASNDDTECGASGLGSVVTFNAAVGTTYRIAVAGFDAEEGTFTLSTNAPPPFTGGGSATPPVVPALPAIGPVTAGSVKYKGTNKAIVTVNAPAAGTVTATDAAGGAKALRASASKKKKALIKKSSATATKAGPVNLTVKLTSAGKKVQKAKGKVKVKVKLAFAPSGASASAASSTTKKLVFKAKAKK